MGTGGLKINYGSDFDIDATTKNSFLNQVQLLVQVVEVVLALMLDLVLLSQHLARTEIKSLLILLPVLGVLNLIAIS